MAGEKILLTDSSTNWLVQMLLNSRQEIIRSSLSTRTSAEDDWFASATDEFLGEESPDALILGRGPGSFTSLRISFSYLRTLAQLRGWPVATVSSLQLWGEISGAGSDLLIPANRTLLFGADEEEEKAETAETWKKKKPSAVVFANNPEISLAEFPENRRFYCDGTLTLKKLVLAQTIIFAGVEAALPHYVHQLDYKKKSYEF